MISDIEKRINTRSATIKSRLTGGLNANGKIDLDKLQKHDEELFKVLKEFAASKTWRDDPETTARDVAKLIEARSQASALGEALDKLSISDKE